MKILIYIHSLYSGGAERVVCNLIGHWVKKYEEIVVVTNTTQANDFYELPPGVARISLNSATKSGGVFSGLIANINRIKSLRKILKHEKPSCAIGIMTTANIILSLSSIGLRKIITIGTEHIHPPTLPLAKFWEISRKYTYGYLNIVVALTEKSAIWLKENTNSRQIAVIPNPVEYPLPTHPPFLPPPTRQTGQKLLLAVGRLTYQKGFDLLIEAFAKLASKHPQWALYILGEGPDRTELEAQIAATGLQERIHLPGRAGNMGDWYQAADIYVMSSRFEGYPNTLIEAMAYGVPVVSFDCDTGPREIIECIGSGKLVSHLDIVNLIGAIEESFENHKKEEISKNEIVKILSPEIIITSWDRLINNADLSMANKMT